MSAPLGQSSHGSHLSLILSDKQGNELWADPSTTLNWDGENTVGRLEKIPLEALQQTAFISWGLDLRTVTWLTFNNPLSWSFEDVYFPLEKKHALRAPQVASPDAPLPNGRKTKGEHSTACRRENNSSLQLKGFSEQDRHGKS